MTYLPAVHLRAIVYGLAVLAAHTELQPFAAVAYFGWLLSAWDGYVADEAPRIESIPARPGHP